MTTYEIVYQIVTDADNEEEALDDARSLVRQRSFEPLFVRVLGTHTGIPLSFTESELLNLDFFGHCVPVNVRDDDALALMEKIRKALRILRDDPQ